MPDEHEDNASPAQRVISPELMLLAFRLAVSLQDAQESCPHRACRKTGRCHMDIDAGGAHCGANFHGHRAGHDVATMLVFLDEYRATCADVPWSRHDRSPGDSVKRRHDKADAAQ